MARQEDLERPSGEAGPLLLLAERLKSSCLAMGVGVRGTLSLLHVHACTRARGRAELRPGRDFTARDFIPATFHVHKVRGEQHF